MRPEDIEHLGRAAKDDYAALKDVFAQAVKQASDGKGRERHADEGVPFEKQKICQGGQRFGVGAPAYQAWKKTEEAYRMATKTGFKDGKQRAVAELLGAMNYCAAAVIVLQEAIVKERIEDVMFPREGA